MAEDIDTTKPVQTLTGKPVRILCDDLRCPYYPIVGAVDCGDIEICRSWTRDGSWTTHQTYELAVMAAGERSMRCVAREEVVMEVGEFDFPDREKGTCDVP